MKKILIVVDVQKGFVNENTENTKNKIIELLNQNIFDLVISSKYKNIDGSNIEKFTGWTDLKDENSQAIIPEVEEKTNYIITKTDAYSAYTKELINILKKELDGKMPEKVFICGLDTECCVLKTAVDFFEDGIKPIVLADYCFSSLGKNHHIAGLRSLESLIGNNNIIYGDMKEI